jgi:M6 family metalloprotease-like protein
MPIRNRVLAALAVISYFAIPARAVIVYDGKVVPAWPDQPSPAALSKQATGAATAPVHFYPHPAGTVWGLTLLVDFSDTPPAFTKEEVDAWLNLKGFNRFNCNGSVRDYYHDVSNGKVDFQNEIHGYYRAKNPKSYYEGGTGYARAGELVDEVLAYFDAEVDFSKFDNDKDGKVEAISIVYAGQGQTYAQGLWPHAGSINQKRDGVSLTRYMMSDMGTSLSLYVFCHECGHMLFGWPDLYGFGDYCLMANRPNDQNPPLINDFFRADQGWLDVVDVDKSMNAFYSIAANGTVGYRFVNPARPQELFFWTNYSNVGRRAVLKGRGLLVLHFDKDIGSNNPPNPLCLAVVQADGKDELGKTTWPSPGSDVKDYFYKPAAGTTAGAAFGASTTPASKWNDGSASGLNIHDIGAAADTMGFYVGTGAIGLRPPVAATAIRIMPAARPRTDARGVIGARAIGPRMR